MASQTFSVSQAAIELGVSASTVRRLCDEFSERLSDSAKRLNGGARRFDKTDIAKLSEIIKLRAEGLSDAAIDAQIANMVFPAPIVEASPASQEAPSAAQTALIVVEAMQSALAPLTARVDAIQTAQDEHQAKQDARIDALESIKLKQQLRIEFLEAQRLRVDAAWLVVAAFIAGLIVGLAVWWFQ